MVKSSEQSESLRRDIDALTRWLDVSSVLTMCLLPRRMCVEASVGRLKDTYPIDAEGHKSVHKNGAQPLYCEHMVGHDAPLHARDSHQETEWAGNEDGVEFGPSSYLDYPVHTFGDTPYDTTCVLNSRPRGYSTEERALLEELQRKAEAPLAETVS